MWALHANVNLSKQPVEVIDSRTLGFWTTSSGQERITLLNQLHVGTTKLSTRCNAVATAFVCWIVLFAHQEIPQSVSGTWSVVNKARLQHTSWSSENPRWHARRSLQGSDTRRDQRPGPKDKHSVSRRRTRAQTTVSKLEHEYTTLNSTSAAHSTQTTYTSL